MATGSTPVRGRPYPLETDAPDVAADMHALALNLDQVPNVTSGTTLPSSGMVAGDEFMLTTTGNWYRYSGSAWVADANMFWTSVAVNTSALDRHTYGVTATATLTLPSPVLNARVGVYNNSVSGIVTITASSGVIGGLGLGTSGATSITLGASASALTLMADGTNWHIVSGQQDTGWVNLTSFGTSVSAGSPVVAYRVIGDRVQLRGFAESSVATPGNLVQIPTAILPPASSDNRYYPFVYNGGAATAALSRGTPNWLILNYASSPSAGSSLDFSNIYWYLS